MSPVTRFFDGLARKEEAKQAFCSLDAAGPTDLKRRKGRPQRPQCSATVPARRGPCARRVAASFAADNSANGLCLSDRPPELGTSIAALLHERGQDLERAPFPRDTSKSTRGKGCLPAAPLAVNGDLQPPAVPLPLSQHFRDAETTTDEHNGTTTGPPLACRSVQVPSSMRQPHNVLAVRRHRARPVSAQLGFDDRPQVDGSLLEDSEDPQRFRPASAGPRCVKLCMEVDENKLWSGHEDKDDAFANHGASASVPLHTTSASSLHSSDGSDQEAPVQLPANIERMLEYHRKKGLATQMGQLRQTLMSHGIDDGKHTGLALVSTSQHRRGALDGPGTRPLPSPALSSRRPSVVNARSVKVQHLGSQSDFSMVTKEDSAMQIWKRVLMARAKAQTRDSRLESKQPRLSPAHFCDSKLVPGTKGLARGRQFSRQPSALSSDDEVGSAAGDTEPAQVPLTARANTARGYGHADKQTTTGLVFEHQDLAAVPFKVVRFSSQSDSMRHAAANLSNSPCGHGSSVRELGMWQSSGPPEQWLVLDVHQDVELCGIELRCSGTQADPKDLTVLRGANNDGPWVICRRTFVHAGPQGKDQIMHKILFDGGVTCRYWRIVINQNWGKTCHVCLRAPLTLLAKPRHIADAQGATDVPPAAVPGRPRDLATVFSEAVNLSSEERELRLMARRNNVPLDYAERIRQEFRKFDGGVGSLSFEQFAQILRAMVVHKPAGARYRGVVNGDVPEARIRRTWQEVDTDQSGRVEFEELLVWFYSRFHDSESSSLQRGSTGSAQLARQMAGGRPKNDQARRNYEQPRPR